jgi:two-component system sensor histidine kinase FlrB
MLCDFGGKLKAKAQAQDIRFTMMESQTKSTTLPDRDTSVSSSEVKSQIGSQELGEAFVHFIEATRNLEASQQALSEEIYRLTEDLAKSNADLKLQIEAKGRLAEELAALLSALPTGVIILQHGKVYAFNDVSVSLAPWLEVGSGWHIPRQWTAIDEDHFRTSQDEGGQVLRPESRELADGRQMLLLHNVTTTFRAREQAEREAKLAAMGRMAAEIAHQLRTPLATATLYASHLGRTQLTPDQRFKFAAQLNQQLTWLDGLVSRMMSFLRNRPSNTEIVCVEELLSETKASIEAVFESRGVKLELFIEGGNCLLTVQRDQIRGGIVSILENALTVSPEGQSVLVRARAARSRLDLFIEDRGPGISQDMLERLFEPFATGSPKGTGLGLAIAKAAIEAHRGEIHASNRPDGGAKFHIVLPVFEPL